MNDYFVHPQAICDSSEIGEGTRIWAFAHVLPGAVIGSEVNICDHVFIENDVRIGNRVTVKSGVQLWDGMEIQDDVFVGPNVTFTNDRYPRSKRYPKGFAKTTIEHGASIGGGAVVVPGVRIGHNAMVGAGAVVTRDVPPFAIVKGNPALITGYNDSAGSKMVPSGVSLESSIPASPNASILSLTRVADMRGSLVAAEFQSDLPFNPQRFFVVFDVPSRDVRGEHAHRQCEQVLVCLRGSVHAVTDDGRNREEFVLDAPDKGLYMKRMVWGTQYSYSSDAILAVFASHPYDPSDYIRSYSDFLSEVGSSGNR